MKIIDGFIADNGKKQTKIELVQIQLKYSFPKRYAYALVRNQSLRDFLQPYFTRFFAERRFTKIKNEYKSRWLAYNVYET